ncbi:MULTISPECIES: peptide deformylase [Congzhengia]|jgi:peptide deformylase|uniref:Peptide deformylase n=1 Tax=Congzhengia minquanensis TaxID=2763657 RepID=A0A926HZE8_9FIRM|nr:peptide deformylase [Congzhengia minquanensis]MBC8541100.1 peptide deformylase [Congzhengia minquanensis]MBD8946996.1 peptide deformylase [Clostridiales bacterium]HBL81043.1 peptide deformylase [Clostridiales bacterium]
MAIRKVLTIPDDNDFLRKKSRDVTMIDDRILTLLDDMKETLYAENGVGLAAPQVGILRRVVVIDVGEGLIELINPVIVYKKGEQINAEGCLSIPGRSGTVSRPEKVRVRAIDRNNKEFTIEGEGLLAIALCHEIDHLNGTLYVDKMIAEVEN